MAGGPFCCPPATPWLLPESCSRPAVPRLCHCRGWLLYTCRTLPSLNFIRAPLVHSPSLSSSLWMEVLYIPAAVPRVVSPANLISVHSSRGLVKVLSSTGPVVIPLQCGRCLNTDFNSITKPKFNPSVRWRGCWAFP